MSESYRNGGGDWEFYTNIIAFLRRCWVFSHCSIQAVVESSPNGDISIRAHPMQASACKAGDPDLIPGSGRSPAEGNGNLLQYSCLENPINKGTLRATVHEVTGVRHDLATKWSEIVQSCPTLRDPMDCSLPGSSIHGIFQARVLEWGAIAFSNDLATKPPQWPVLPLPL